MAIYHLSILPTRPTHQAQSDRICSILLNDISIVTAYAPVESANREARETFYADLAAHATHLRTLSNSIIMSGDFNAQLAGQGHATDNGNGQLTETDLHT